MSMLRLIRSWWWGKRSARRYRARTETEVHQYFEDRAAVIRDERKNR